MNLNNALLLAGLLHFTMLPVSLLVPKIFRWKQQLRSLTPMNRKIVWVHSVYIGLTVLALGTLTLFAAPEIVAGTQLGIAFSTFMGLFWFGRLLIQFFYYTKNEWPKAWWAIVGRHALTLLFIYWSVVYLAPLFIER